MVNGRCEKHWGFSIFHLTFPIQDAFFSILVKVYQESGPLPPAPMPAGQPGQGAAMSPCLRTSLAALSRPGPVDASAPQGIAATTCTPCNIIAVRFEPTRGRQPAGGDLEGREFR